MEQESVGKCPNLKFWVSVGDYSEMCATKLSESQARLSLESWPLINMLLAFSPSVHCVLLSITVLPWLSPKWNTCTHVLFLGSDYGNFNARHVPTILGNRSHPISGAVIVIIIINKLIIQAEVQPVWHNSY